ncbi:substrate-binding domain-containing protein [Flammeovirgaceae bacterium SG7u.111]|nr:substrate-binding domain-containing protein [Flammeovirgaceae bacterium SG7u.132]WPO35001.1 substrate-binding domain-containing protein [Flammeovirgaceae bacterium SG7u.111]
MRKEKGSVFLLGKLYPIFWIVIILSLQACREQGQKISYTIGFSQCTGADTWRRTMHEDMKREISFHPNAELIIKDAENSSEKQLAQIEELLKAGIDLLIISPNEAEPITPIIDEIFHQGIPVIVIDRKTSSNFYTAYIGADNYEIGKIAGKYIGELLKGNGKIIEIWGLPGSTPAVERHRGFTESLSEFPNVEIIEKVEGKWEVDTVRNVFPAVLEQIAGADLIFAHNDIMGLGAYDVCKDYGREDDFYFVGIDGLPGPKAGLQFVSDGILDATFLYPTGGEQAIQIAMDILSGKTVNKENILQTTLINKGNIKVMKQQTDRILSQQKDIVRQENHIKNQLEIYQNQQVLMYILLASLTCSLLFGFYILYSLKEKQQVNRNLKSKNEEIINQRNQIEAIAKEAGEATQAKFKFFTNISHEFRTPLTLVMASVEEMQEFTSSYSKKFKKDLDLINRNAARLLRLVNQLMDFRKIENNKMDIWASKHDIVKFVKDIMVEFENLATKQQIDFYLSSNINNLEVWFDLGMLDKVLFNLLSNAFKFTKEGGYIRVGIEEKALENNVVLVIEDSGRGMSKEHVEHAFDRFYKGNNYETFGIGLGLSLSKEIIKLHHGEISVTSEKGKGTRFEVALPLGKNHFSSNQLSDEGIHNTQQTGLKLFVETSELVSLKEPEKGTKKQRSYSLLIIEDNDELRDLLTDKLKETYEVFEAADGKIGLDKAYDKIPDLIICDIMIPKMNGLAITKTLKNDIRTSHIPIILLTAKSTTEQKIEGVQTGADAYIVKPFSIQYLLENIRNIIKTRELLKGKYSHELPATEIINAGNSIDKKFINHFKAIVEENLGNADYGANEIAEELGLSRVQLYRKITALMGVGINDYIKSVRLKKARVLILENDMTIAEVAYQVGFSSPAYFSTAFKTKYHVSPSEFLKNKKLPKS